MNVNCCKFLGQDECCKEVEITSTGLARRAQQKSLGMFKYLNRTNGHMVYTNGKNRYLHFSPDNEWLVRKLKRQSY